MIDTTTAGRLFRLIQQSHALACAVILLGVPGSALAEPSAPPRLIWHAPPDCPDFAQVRRTIHDWLERSVEPVDASGLLVEAAASRSSDGFRAEVSLTSASGRAQRRLAADSCNTLVDVLALNVALAAATMSKAPAPAPEKPSSQLHAAVRVSGAGVLGRFPHLSTAFELAGALLSDWLRLELAVSYAPIQSVRYAEHPDVGAEVQVGSGALRGCVVDHSARLELLGCVGLELGSMRARGVGTRVTGTWDLLLGEIVAGPALRYALGGIFLWFGLDASVGVARPSYSFRYLGQLYRPGLFGGRAILGIELQI